MAAKKVCIGTVACLVCGNEIPARENENGTLDLGCGYCDFVGYAKSGTESYEIIGKSINRKNVPDPEPADVKPSPSPAPAPEPSKQKGKLSWQP